MTFKLSYPGGEVEKPDAHSALQQIKYLERDDLIPITITDHKGAKITQEELGQIALKSFSAEPNATQT